MRQGKSFIICGPSGVGKGTVISRLLAQDPSLYFSVSATTRAPRPGETDGIHYHFLSMEQFERWIAEDQFLEHAAYVGNRYGTPKRFVDEAMAQGRDVLLDIEILFKTVKILFEKESTEGFSEEASAMVEQETEGDDFAVERQETVRKEESGAV